MAPLAALMMLASFSPAHAAEGDSFMRDVPNPHALSGIIKESLLLDPSGKSLLSPSKCHQASARSCANAWDYLVMLWESDPEAKADGRLTTVDQLPGFLDSLVEAKMGDEEYNMACLAPIGSDVFNPVFNCIQRRFEANEPGWQDPVSGRIVLARNCTNPVGQTTELIVTVQPCVTVGVPEIPPGTVVLHYEVVSGGKIPHSVRCPDINPCDDCRWGAVEEDFTSKTGLVIKDREEHKIISPKPGFGEKIKLSHDILKEGGAVIFCADVMGSDGKIHRSGWRAMFFRPGTTGGPAFQVPSKFTFRDPL
ncbi:hypothetical protein H0X32_04050 [Patescibacteria group bacterium]|nr:hypothetical protein [Patescibacteria group bacterium]